MTEQTEQTKETPIAEATSCADSEEKSWPLVMSWREQMSLNQDEFYESLRYSTDKSMAGQHPCAVELFEAIRKDLLDCERYPEDAAVLAGHASQLLTYLSLDPTLSTILYPPVGA